MGPGDGQRASHGRAIDALQQDSPGTFCRKGTICRETRAARATKAVVLSNFFRWHGACSMFPREFTPHAAA
jgi:hypothetical protein